MMILLFSLLVVFVLFDVYFVVVCSGCVIESFMCVVWTANKLIVDNDHSKTMCAVDANELWCIAWQTRNSRKTSMKICLSTDDRWCPSRFWRIILQEIDFNIMMMMMIHCFCWISFCWNEDNETLRLMKLIVFKECSPSPVQIPFASYAEKKPCLFRFDDSQRSWILPEWR